MFASMRTKASIPSATKASAGALMAIALAAGGGGFSARAEASPLFNGAVLPLAAQILTESQCGTTLMGVRNANLAVQTTAYGSPDKSSAILGGAPSALAAIKMEQRGQSSASLVASGPIGATTAPAIRPLEPALGPSSAVASFCAGLTDNRQAFAIDQGTMQAGARRPYAAVLTQPRSSPDDFLSSKRVDIGRTMFDADWARVRSSKVSRKDVSRALRGQRGTGLDVLEQVNRWTNQNVRYVEDRDLWGKSDVWSTARTTLKMRKGDCEDIAIAKMQLLAAAGVPRNDMVLTIARDLVRRADHAVLIVKHEGRWLMLDNATDKVLDARYSYDYRPVLSFSENKSWLHGY